jgi:hypothetical protein
VLSIWLDHVAFCVSALSDVAWSIPCEHMATHQRAAAKVRATSLLSVCLDHVACCVAALSIVVLVNPM